MRPCQPSPGWRNRCTTVRDNRMVMRSLVGDFCLPRTPSLRRNVAGSTSAAGRHALFPAD